jgi:hypothetical protein
MKKKTKLKKEVKEKIKEEFNSIWYKEKKEIVEKIVKNRTSKAKKEETKNNQPKTKKNPKWAWAKKKIDVFKLQELKTCFAVWMSDEEACYFCDIWVWTLYNFQKKNPKFLKEKEILKKSIDLQALFNVWRIIKIVESRPTEEYWTTSKWWLKSCVPRFKDKVEVTWTFSLIDLHKKLQEDEKINYNTSKKQLKK